MEDWQPSRAKARASPAPIPCEAPVINTDLPRNSISMAVSPQSLQSSTSNAWHRAFTRALSGPCKGAAW